MNKLCLFLMAMCLSFCALAQQPHHLCGTKEGRSEWLRHYQQNPEAHLRSNGEPLWVPIQIHIVGLDNGTGYYNAARLMSDFCELRAQFEETDIELYLADEFNYVNSTQLYEHETFQEGGEVMDEIDPLFPDVVNVYISPGAARNCGYAAYWINRVVVSTNCMDSGSVTWAHEMGHVFSLPHTFSGNDYEPDDDFTIPAPNHFEKVDGSNCQDAGDGFCDTPADYLGFRWPCQEDSTSVFATLDPDSIEFNADGYYFMSYSFDGCAGGFSQEQIDAMSSFVLEERPYYLEDGVSFDSIRVTEMAKVEPPNGGEMVVDAGQRLSWSPLENVTSYVVQVSRFENFLAAEFRGVTQDTFIHIDAQLLEGKTYYWRASVFNPAHTCNTGFLPTNSFEAIGAWPLSTQDNDLVESMSVIPNPVSSSKQAVLNYTLTNAQDVNINIVGITGQQFQTQSLRAQAGENTIDLNLKTLAAGLYYVVIEGEVGRSVSKVVVGY